MLILALLACGNDYLVLDGTETPGEDVEELEEIDWSQAELIVTSPLSASFVPLEDGTTFSAYLENAEGEILDFDEITWKSSVASDWNPSGSEFEDILPIGVHDLQAKAILPNGDRVSSTVGGVLVQSVYAGTYTGNVVVDLITDQLSTACSGAATLTIDATGEVVAGAANCFLSIQGIDIDGEYIIGAQNDRGDLEGELALDLFGFEVPLGLEGDVSEEGELNGSFSGDLAGFADIEGELTLTRISREAPL
ncbi:MAG: hypothetical protein ACI9VR_000969 [Cognaticolwellia sp.]|jgi:hypothetical protein